MFLIHCDVDTLRFGFVPFKLKTLSERTRKVSQKVVEKARPPGVKTLGAKIRMERKVERANPKTTRARVVRGLSMVLKVMGARKVPVTCVVAWDMLLLNVGIVVPIKCMQMTMGVLQLVGRLQLYLRQLHFAVIPSIPAPLRLR